MMYILIKFLIIGRLKYLAILVCNHIVFNEHILFITNGCHSICYTDQDYFILYNLNKLQTNIEIADLNV
jgi:hypothetical protein